MIRVVLEDFTIDDSIKLSYVSPSKSIFGTEDALPVFIRNDFQVVSFMSKHKYSGELYSALTNNLWSKLFGYVLFSDNFVAF